LKRVEKTSAKRKSKNPCNIRGFIHGVERSSRAIGKERRSRSRGLGKKGRKTRCRISHECGPNLTEERRRNPKESRRGRAGGRGWHQTEKEKGKRIDQKRRKPTPPIILAQPKDWVHRTTAD